MPLFSKKRDESSKDILEISTADNSSMSTTPRKVEPKLKEVLKVEHSFQCQLTNDNQIKVISNFINIKELHERVAEIFNIDPNKILFCTLNTHKVDMDHLLESEIGFDDFIFIHIEGQKKEIDFYKSEESLGLTVTDNGVGKVFIKRIRESSQVAKVQQGLIDVGDHIEMINGECFLGKRHYDVAKKLRSIDVGTKLTIQLISPDKGQHAGNKSRSDIYSRTTSNIVCGKQNATDDTYLYEDLSSNDMNMIAIEIISGHIEKVFGTDDRDMAQVILDIGNRTDCAADFPERIKEEFSEGIFSEILVHDFWGIISNAKAGLLRRSVPSSYTNSSRPSISTTGYTNDIYEDHV